MVETQRGPAQPRGMRRGGAEAEAWAGSSALAHKAEGWPGMGEWGPALGSVLAQPGPDDMVHVGVELRRHGVG